MTAQEEKEKRLRLILRPLTGAHIQAGNILAGDKSRTSIETFASFCAELNRYTRVYADSDEIAEALNEIPEIQYRRLRTISVYSELAGQQPKIVSIGPDSPRAGKVRDVGTALARN